MTGEQDPPTSSNYGAVAAGDYQHRHDETSASNNLGLGARLYLAVLLVVGLSGLVGFVPLVPDSWCPLRNEHFFLFLLCPLKLRVVSIAVFSSRFPPQRGEEAQKRQVSVCSIGIVDVTGILKGFIYPLPDGVYCL